MTTSENDVSNCATLVMLEESVNKPIWQSQRGIVLMFTLTLLFALAIIDGLETFVINEAVLLAFTAGVGAGFVYFFKSKNEEAQLLSKNLQ